METLESYLTRKAREIDLLNASLTHRLPLSRAATPADIIRKKFQIASALKAEHAVQDWALTETAWAHPGTVRSGPFEFSYDYQRADLDVRGPSFYVLEHPEHHDTVYTSSGMAAISALLFASAKMLPSADILQLPGSYGETIELIENHARHLRLVEMREAARDVAACNGGRRILMLDTSIASHGIEAVLRCASPCLDLVIFDTTCFASGSGRIRRVVNWARQHNLPLALVRSHTKLDSLGIEYGRLGSVVFVDARQPVRTGMQALMSFLAEETRQAVRLFGGAALPAHFPPFAGNTAYRELTDRRVACILRNSRRAARLFSARLAGSPAPLNFAHGLYLTLVPTSALDEDQARELSVELSADLSGAGLPLRHAGSFGFDFAATEWFHDTLGDRYLVRIAVPDLPTRLWDELAAAIADWWSRRNRDQRPFAQAGSETTLQRQVVAATN